MCRVGERDDRAGEPRHRRQPGGGIALRQQGERCVGGKHRERQRKEPADCLRPEECVFPNERGDKDGRRHRAEGDDSRLRGPDAADAVANDRRSDDLAERHRCRHEDEEQGGPFRRHVRSDDRRKRGADDGDAAGERIGFPEAEAGNGGVEGGGDDGTRKPQRREAEILPGQERPSGDEVQGHEHGADAEEDAPGDLDPWDAETDHANSEERDGIEREQRHLQRTIDSLAGIADVDERGDDRKERACEKKEVGLLLDEPAPIHRLTGRRGRSWGTWRGCASRRGDGRGRWRSDSGGRSFGGLDPRAAGQRSQCVVVVRAEAAALDRADDAGYGFAVELI